MTIDEEIASSSPKDLDVGEDNTEPNNTTPPSTTDQISKNPMHKLESKDNKDQEGSDSGDMDIESGRKLEKVGPSTNTLRRQLKEEELVFTTDYLLDISNNFDPDRSPKDMFTLGSLYARATNDILLRQGEEWLKKLLSESHYELLGPNYKADCCFLLAWANFRLREYKEARKYAEKLVQINPLNYQAVELIALIDEELLKEAKKGMILGGLAAGAATLSFGLVGLAAVSAVMVAVNRRK